jgi:(2Fe-2S) ferredoxin
MYDTLPPQHRDNLLRKPEYRELLWEVRDVTEVVVLICGHGGRDQRCGLYGPLLREAFEERLPEQGVEVLRGPVEVEVPKEALEVDGEALEVEGEAAEGEVAEVEGGATGMRYAARVGLISHIGGHKFAGNVIVYLPPGLKTEDGEAHPLAGHGIWYGRVEPKHVEGIVGETILKGRVIEELFRGGIKQNGEMLRL